MNNFLFLKIYILLCRLFGYSVFLAGFFMSDNFGFLCGKKSIFFCGIGGASMSGLAAICSLNGFSVSGSDCDISSDSLSFLQSYGIRVFTSHSAENIAGSGPHRHCRIFQSPGSGHHGGGYHQHAPGRLCRHEFP